MIVWCVIFGFIAGIVGGMGMGGGTLLVPLLSLLDIPQRQMQAINLISFLPMCTVALIFHFKNKLVVTKNIGFTVIPACLSSLGGAVLAQNLDNGLLKILFGIFILVVGIRMMVQSFRKKKLKCVKGNVHDRQLNVAANLPHRSHRSS